MKVSRYIVSVACALALLALAFVFVGGSPWVYLDLPSLVITVGLTVALLRSAWSFREMGGAFSAAFDASAGDERWKAAMHFFASARRYLLMSGFLAVVMGVIAMLANLSDRSRLGPNLAIALLSILYAVLLGLFVCLPLEIRCKRQVKKL